MLNKTEKELLLKDLCARLPYGVYCKIDGIEDEPVTTEESERYCTITKEEYDSHKEYTCMPESADDETCKDCKWYKEI